MPLFDATLSILERSMDVRLERQNLLASNLANANTPGYQAKDLDFEGAMHSAAQQLEQSAHHSHLSNPVNASQLDSFSLSGDQQSDPFAPPVSLSLPAPPLNNTVPLVEAGGAMGLDGNRVDTDHAMVALSSNAINYGASAKAAAKKLAILTYAANDGQG